jgi:hypothetical protein
VPIGHTAVHRCTKALPERNVESRFTADKPRDARGAE